jgi:hypothetical protein
MALLVRNNGTRRRAINNKPPKRGSLNNRLRTGGGGATVGLDVLEGSILPLLRFEPRTVQPPNRHYAE